MTILFVVVGLTIGISAMCSLFESTLYSTRMGALEAATASDRLRQRAKRFISMKKNIGVPTASILTLNTIANTAGATVSGMYAASLLGPKMVPLFSILLTLSILFIAEILPKTYGAIHWRGLWPHTVVPLAFIAKALAPLIWLSQKFSHFFTRGQTFPVLTEAEVQASIRLAAQTDQLSAAELELLTAVFHFDELNTRQVMVPRAEVVTFELGWSLEKCLSVASETQHTRYPVCNGSLDEVTGIIHIKDLLGMSSEESFDMKSSMRPARIVPESLPISQLLKQMQHSKQHMAIVVNEHGSTVGVVTLENIVEQLVGSVEDEFDSEEPDILVQGKHEFLVRGTTSLHLINRELNLKLSSSDADTLSGLLVAQRGRFLKKGEVIPLEGAVVKVMEVEGRRATRLLVSLIQKEVQADSPGPSNSQE